MLTDLYRRLRKRRRSEELRQTSEKASVGTPRPRHVLNMRPFAGKTNANVDGNRIHTEERAYTWHSHDTNRLTISRSSAAQA